MRLTKEELLLNSVVDIAYQLAHAATELGVPTTVERFVFHLGDFNVLWKHQFKGKSRWTAMVSGDWTVMAPTKKGETLIYLFFDYLIDERVWVDGIVLPAVRVSPSHSSEGTVEHFAHAMAILHEAGDYIEGHFDKKADLTPEEALAWMKNMNAEDGLLPLEIRERIAKTLEEATPRVREEMQGLAAQDHLEGIRCILLGKSSPLHETVTLSQEMATAIRKLMTDERDIRTKGMLLVGADIRMIRLPLPQEAT